MAGALKETGVAYQIWDASLEGTLFLLAAPLTVPHHDRWTQRAVSHRERHLQAVKSPDPYENPARYRRAIKDLTHLLARQGMSSGIRLGLADYRDPRRSPVSTSDLLAAAERPQENPFYPYFRQRVHAIMDEGEPAAIGISLNYLSQALSTFSLLGVMKRLGVRARIVVGGSLVTSWHRYLRGKNPFVGLIDDLVIGPGEEAIVRWAGKDWSGRSALPAYDAFPNAHYLSPVKIAPVALSRGCYYGRCRFCLEREEGNPYVAVNSVDIRDRLTYLVATYRPGLIHFLDYALSPRVMRDLVDLSPGVPWYGFARITEELADVSFCRGLKESGCVMLKLGVESGVQAVLDAMEKGIQIEIVSRALKTLSEAGIATYVYLLFGTPEESRADAEETMRFVRDHAAKISFLNPAIFNLPVGSRPDLKCSPFYGGELSLYEDFEHPQGWSRREVRAFLSRTFSKERGIREILLRTPPVFSSNHAPFFLYPRGKPCR